MTVPSKMNFFDAEDTALHMAYTQFFGEGKPVGIAFTFIIDRQSGKPWSDEEKAWAKYTSERAISDLKRKNLISFIEAGIVPDCAMARRYMATGSGYTSNGYTH